MKKLLLLVFIFGGLLCEGQSWVWARQAFGFGQEGNAVATDSIGNVFETGYFVDTLIFGSDTLSTKYLDIYLVKYDSSGNELWLKKSSAQSITQFGVYSVSTDNIGDSYITGYYNDTISFGAYALNTGFSNNLFQVKYDANGSVLWAKNAVPLGINSSILGFAGCADRIGNSFVTGFFSDTVSFGMDTLKSPFPGIVFLIKYDPNGNVVWVKSAISASKTSGAIGSSVSTDQIGNSYLTGFFYDTVSFGAFTLFSTKNHSAFIVKYDVNGNVLWAKSITLASPVSCAYGTALSADSNGNSYLAGVFRDTVYFDAYPIFSIYSPYYNSFLAKYDANGNILWVKSTTLKSNRSGATIYSLSSDNFGNAYISGQLYDTVTFGTFILIEDSSGSDGAFIAKYDSTGNVVCAERFPGGGDDQNGICADRFGNVYWGGDFEPATFILGKDTLTRGYSETAFLAKWRPCIDSNITTYTTPLPNKPSVSLYPNPNNGAFTIAIAGAQNLVSSVEIYNVMGQKVFTACQPQTSKGALIAVNIASQPNGIYLYRVIKEDGSLVGEGKIVIEK